MESVRGTSHISGRGSFAMPFLSTSEMDTLASPPPRAGSLRGKLNALHLQTARRYDKPVKPSEPRRRSLASQYKQKQRRSTAVASKDNNKDIPLQKLDVGGTMRAKGRQKMLPTKQRGQDTSIGNGVRQRQEILLPLPAARSRKPLRTTPSTDVNDGGTHLRADPRCTTNIITGVDQVTRP